MRDIVEPILEIRYANATPIISNSSPSIIILGKIRQNPTILLINTCLLFSIPKSFEVNMKVMDVGIITRDIIWIANIDSTYAEKKIGINIGANTIPQIVKIPDIIIENNFIFLVDCPDAS